MTRPIKLLMAVFLHNARCVMSGGGEHSHMVISGTECFVICNIRSVSRVVNDAHDCMEAHNITRMFITITYCLRFLLFNFSNLRLHGFIFTKLLLYYYYVWYWNVPCSIGVV